MMQKIWPGILSLLLPCLCQAQFSDSVTHYIRLSASGNINRTATATAYLLSNDARFSVRNKRTTLNTAANWVYGKQAALLTNNDVAATADFNVYPDSSKLYYWGLGNYTSSFSLRINRQLQTGVGIGYNFVNNENSWLNISEGLLYETSSFVRNNADESYRTVRNSLRVSYRFAIGSAITFSGSNFLQNSLRDGGDYILRTNNTAAYKLNRWLSFTAALAYNQVRRTGAENLLFTYGITAEHFF